MSSVLYVAALMVVGGAAMAGAQERDLSSPYFDCPFIHYFDSGCPELEREQAGSRPQAPPAPEEPAAGEEEGEDYEQEWVEENPELLVPLFPRESLSRDTPELYRTLLMRPTLGNARRFVRWYSRRMERIRQAQALIGVAGSEFLAERAAAE